MLHKWEIKEFKKEDGVNEYRVRFRCQRADFDEIKEYLRGINIEILREFKSITSEYDYVFYIQNLEENDLQRFIGLLKEKCNDGEFIRVESKEPQDNDGLKYFYELLKNMYNSTAIEDIELQDEYYKMLKDTSRMITSVTDFKQLTNVLFNITKQMKYKKAALMLKEEDVLRLVDSYGISKYAPNIYIIDWDFWKIIEQKKEVTFKKDIPQNIIFKNEMFEIISPDLIIPLMQKDESEGIILLGDRVDLYKTFRSEEKELLEIIAGQIAAATKNLKLSKEAIVDTLTNVYRYNYFTIRLKEEVYRSIQYQRPLSLLMVDLDNFKKINDTYGHQVGNLVLKEVARILKDNTRPSDVVARYGGDEFVVIFPEAKTKDSLFSNQLFCEHIKSVVDIAKDLKNKIEKIRIKVNKESTILQKAEQEIGVSASMGLTFLSGKEKISPEQFISDVDKSLYMAKMDGKNQVKIWDEKNILEHLDCKKE